jgi:HEAT repeat protein
MKKEGVRLTNKNQDAPKGVKIEELLRSGEAEARRDAVYSLKKLKDKARAVNLLIQCFQDSDWRVRKSATEILIGLKEKSVISKLIDTLYSENANTRNSAIEVLTAFGADAVESLIKGFKTANPDVKKFIIDIVGNVRDSRVPHFLLNEIFNKANDDNVKAAAIEHLSKIKNNEVTDKLISVLKGDDIFLSFYAVNALGKIGDERSASALISSLTRKDLRRPAIKALGEIAGSAALSAITPFIKDESRSVCEETIIAVENIYIKGSSEDEIVSEIRKAAGDNAVNILLPFAESHKKEVKRAALLILCLLKEKSAIQPILDISSEMEPQESVLRALAYIGKSLPDALMHCFNASEVYQKRILCDAAGRTASPVFFKPLTKMLKDKDSHTRAKAARALSKIGISEAAAHIKPLLADEYEDIQEAAIAAMAALKEGVAIEEMIGMLSDKNPVLRRGSARLLGLIGDRRAVEPLGVALKDSDLRVRNAVVEAIGAIDGRDVLKYLLLALTDEDFNVRRSAAIAISRMKTKRSFESLLLLLSDADAWVRATAIKGLGQSRHGTAVKHLIAALNDKSGIVRNAAIEALAGFREKRVKIALLALLKDNDPEVRSTAVNSLAAFEGVVEYLLPVLKDEDWVVRKQAVDVLGKFFREESSSYLQDVADTDNDLEVRRAAERYLSV